MKILVVEDDSIMRKAISSGLKKYGYAVDSASDGEEALLLFGINLYDAVILDLNLPKIDGISVLKQIRCINQETGVLILSARSEIDDKVYGLDTGANDYMAKPFHFKELDARLRALLRRKFSQADTLIKIGGLTVNILQKSVTHGNNEIYLSRKEYGILEYLLHNRGKTVSAEELIEHIWDSETDLFSNSLKVHINQLKKKLSEFSSTPEIIKNKRGFGYYIVEDCDETDK